MSISVGKAGALKAEPNVVPLIDILLVLIIIFMVITPLTHRGLDALVPQPSPPDAQPNLELMQKTVVVQVSAAGVKINEEESKWDCPTDPAQPCLRRRLEDIFKTRAEKVAFVKGDAEVPFAEVARAIDIMKQAGIEKVGLMTAKVESGQ